MKWKHTTHCIFLVIAAALIPLSALAAENTETSIITGSTLVDSLSQTDQLANQIIDYASSLVGKPYRWGATGPKAYDCSGFTSHVFSNFGLDLSRTSRSQYGEGMPVELSEVRPGDLLFFGGRSNSKRVGHVGIATEIDPLTGDVTFIHSATSKGVRYDSLQESQYFNRRYIGARRVISD